MSSMFLHSLWLDNHPSCSAVDKTPLTSFSKIELGELNEQG